MKLFRIISNAQDGQVFANLGATVGLSEELTAQCVRSLSEPLVRAIDRRTREPEGVLALLDFFGRRRYDRVLTSVQIFGHPRSQIEGETIVLFLLETPAAIDELLREQQEALSLERELMQQILPYAAILVMGAVEHRLREPLQAIIQQLESEGLDSAAKHNPFAALAQIIRERIASENATFDESGRAEDPTPDPEMEETSETEYSARGFLRRLLGQRSAQHAA